MWNQIISPLSVGMLGNFTLGAVHFSWSLVRSWHSSIPNVTQKKPPITVTTSILTDFPDCSSKVPKFNFTSSKSIFYRSLRRIAWPKLIKASPNPHPEGPSPFLLHGATEQSHQVREIAACLSGFHLLGEATKNLDGYWMVRWDSYIFLWDSCCDLIWPY